MHTATLLAIIGLCSLASTQRLTKPTLESDLNYLKPGVTKLPKVHSTHEEWDGHIPTDCAQMAQDNKLDSNDVSTYTVNYDDVSSVPFFHTTRDCNIFEIQVLTIPLSVASRGIFADIKTVNLRSIIWWRCSAKFPYTCVNGFAT